MRNNRWLIGGLAVSLIFNLLLAGFVMGRLSGFGHRRRSVDPTAGLSSRLWIDRRAAIAPAAHAQTIMPMLRKTRGEAP
jgi:hypothetical protein